MENVIHLIFLEEFLVRSRRSRVKVDVLRRCSLPKILTVPPATGNMKFPLLCCVNTSFALRLLARSSDASISSNSSMSADHNVSFPDFHRAQCITEKYTWQDFRAELMQSRQVFGKKKCDIRPLHQKELLVLCMVRRIAVHKVFSHQTRDLCNSTAEVPSLILRTALSAIPFVSER